MKNMHSNSILSVAGCLALFLFGASFERGWAQAVESTIETKSYGGMLYDTDTGSSTFAVRTDESAEPVRYVYTERTTYVDEAGRPVVLKTLKSGQPVMIYYTQEGDRLVASRVVTSKSPVYMGTVTEYSPDKILVRSAATAEPVSYAYTKTTTYVDENGSPISIQQISGKPVTVYYTREGDRLVASRVIVRNRVIQSIP